jgi:hypothetical protein
VRRLAKIIALPALIWCLVISFASASPPSPIAPETSQSNIYTDAAYCAKLSIVANDLSIASAQGHQSNHAVQIQKAQSDLAPILRCGVINGDSLISVDNRPLQIALEQAKDLNFAKQSEAMHSLFRQLSILATGNRDSAGDVDPDHAGDAARSVLRENDFSSDPFPTDTWLGKQFDKAGDWIEALFRRLFGHTAPIPRGHLDPQIIWFIIDVILIAAVAALCYFIFIYGRGWVLRRQITLGGNTLQSGLALNALEAALVSARDYNQLIGLAKRSADSGDFRTGYRLVFLATLVLLDTTGKLKIRNSKTNWEYLRGIREAGNLPLHDEMLPHTEEFDRIWYGVGKTNLFEFDSALSRYFSIQRLVMPDIAPSSPVKATV